MSTWFLICNLFPFLQNLNSDFTDSALGSTEKSPLPYGNFHLREQTMASILTNPKYQPHGGSELGTNAFTYLKFGLPRIVPPKLPGGSSSAGTPGTHQQIASTNFGMNQAQYIGILV